MGRKRKTDSEEMKKKRCKKIKQQQNEYKTSTLEHEDQMDEANECNDESNIEKVRPVDDDLTEEENECNDESNIEKVRPADDDLTDEGNECNDEDLMQEGNDGIIAGTDENCRPDDDGRPAESSVIKKKRSKKTKKHRHHHHHKRYAIGVELEAQMQEGNEGINAGTDGNCRPEDDGQPVEGNCHFFECTNVNGRPAESAVIKKKRSKKTTKHRHRHKRDAIGVELEDQTDEGNVGIIAGTDENCRPEDYGETDEANDDNMASTDENSRPVVRKKAGRPHGSKGECAQRNNTQLDSLNKPLRAYPGEVALKESRNHIEEESKADQRDTLYYPTLDELTSDDSDNESNQHEKRITRYSLKLCLRVADHLKVPTAEGYNDNDLDEEAKMFREFRRGIENIHPSAHFIRDSPYNRLPMPGEYFESPNGIWLAKIIRFGTRSAQQIIHRGDKVDLDYFHNVCLMPIRIFPFVREVLDVGKPLLIFLATRGLNNIRAGHCAILTLVPSSSGIKAYVKDSLPLKKFVRFPRNALPLLDSLKIETVEVYGGFDTEDAVYTSCLNENYKVIGNVMDGAYYWKSYICPYHREDYVKIYDVKLRRFMT